MAGPFDVTQNDALFDNGVHDAVLDERSQASEVHISAPAAAARQAAITASENVRARRRALRRATMSAKFTSLVAAGGNLTDGSEVQASTHSLNGQANGSRMDNGSVADEDAQRSASQLLAERLKTPMVPPNELHDLCATICHELYFHEDPATFKVAMVHAFGPEAIRHAVLINQGPIRSRLAWVVKDTTCAVAWRGSRSPVEWATNGGFSPSVCHLWTDLCEEIEAHGALMALVEHDFYKHLKALYVKAQELGVERMVFSGHSLGGGLALIAHLATLAHMRAHRIEGIELQTIAFAAPMVFHIPEEVSPETSRIVDQLCHTCINWVFSDDVVPRLPGHPDFWVPMVKALIVIMARKKVASSGSGLGYMAWNLFSGDMKLQEVITHLDFVGGPTVDALRRYRHVSQIYLVSPFALGDDNIEVLDHAKFTDLDYAMPAVGDQRRKEELELCFELHKILPRSMARTHCFYRIEHVASGKYLGMTASGNVSLTHSQGTDCDDVYWKREPVPWYVRPADGTFRLLGKSSGKWLTLCGDSLDASGDQYLEGQYWKLAAGPVNSDAYKIEASCSKQMLACFGEHDHQRSSLEVRAPGGHAGDEHLWRFTGESMIREKGRRRTLAGHLLS